MIGVAIAPGATLFTVIPKRPQFHCKVAHQHAQSALAGAIRRESRKGHVLMNRTDVDNPSWLLRITQTAHKRLRQKKRPAQVDRHHLVVIGFRRIPEVRLLLHPRVVHQDVRRTKLAPRRIHQAFHVIHARDIGLNNLCPRSPAFSIASSVSFAPSDLPI